MDRSFSCAVLRQESLDYLRVVDSGFWCAHVSHLVQSHISTCPLSRMRIAFEGDANEQVWTSAEFNGPVLNSILNG